MVLQISDVSKLPHGSLKKVIDYLTQQKVNTLVEYKMNKKHSNNKRLSKDQYLTSEILSKSQN